MHIAKDHLYYGAAVIQIAEDNAYTSINCHKEKKRPVECAYRVNDDIGLYVNYRTQISQPYRDVNNNPVNEYHFGLNKQAQALLRRMRRKYDRLYLAFVCVPDKEICCASWEEIEKLIDDRRRKKGAPEHTYVIHVALPKGCWFRVFVNPPGTKNEILTEFKISRDSFPKRVFE